MTRPSIFVDLDFKNSLERSKCEGKLLLVDATAEWCQPCKLMDRTTWSDDRVVARIGEIAISMQLDVDADEVTARELRIKSMPTVILFRDGVELDRISGLQNPEALLGWIDGVLAGRTALDAVRDEAKSKEDIHARLKLFRALVASEEFDEATELGLWLWEHMLVHRPSMIGVKHSFFVSYLQALVAVHPPAASAIRSVRDATRVDPLGGDFEALRNWLSLNTVLGDEDSTLAWYDALPKERRAGSSGGLIQRKIVPLLVARGRWRDVGIAYADPMSALRGLIELGRTIANTPGTPEQQERHRQLTAKRFRDESVIIVRGLRAAGRSDEAKEVAAAAMEHDASPEMKDAQAAAEGIPETSPPRS